MQITITKTTKTQEVRDIQIPYYYKHDLALDHCDHVTYGKIDERHLTTVSLVNSHINNSVCAQVEKQETDWYDLSCYLTDEHKSTQEEYEKAKAIALKRMQEA